MRTVLGLGSLVTIVVPTRREPFSVRDALGGERFQAAHHVFGERGTSVEYRNAETARLIGEATDRPFQDRNVMLGEALDSLWIADGFGLVFVGQHTEPGLWKLTGWIDPTDDDLSVWNLHMLPGNLHPPAVLR